MTLGDVSHAFDARAFGAFLILLGALNLIPLPPGASFIAGVPLIFVSSQLAIGRQRLWLPERIRSAKLSPAVLGKVMARIGKPLRRLERMARHRLWPSSDKAVAVAIGWFVLLLAVPVIIPAPLTNVLPGFGIVLIGIALSARDGVWLIAGVIAGILALVALAGVYAAAAFALLQFF